MTEITLDKAVSPLLKIHEGYCSHYFLEPGQKEFFYKAAAIRHGIEELVTAVLPDVEKRNAYLEQIYKKYNAQFSAASLRKE